MAEPDAGHLDGSAGIRAAVTQGVHRWAQIGRPEAGYDAAHDAS